MRADSEDSPSPLPDDVIEYLRQRQKQLAPLCPRCGKRKIEEPKTGWCYPCAIDHRERELERKRRHWHKRYGRDAE